MNDDKITYRNICEECDDLVRAAIEEALEYGNPARRLEDLEEKVRETLQETINGHAWVIYYSKAADVVHAIRVDNKWSNGAEENCRECGGMAIGEDEDHDMLLCRLAYHILEYGCNARYEGILESMIEESITGWKAAGKAWGGGIVKYNPGCSVESAHEAEENARSYSPWEFTAKAINDLPWSDDAWEAYDEGINEAFEGLRSRDDVDAWICDDCLLILANDDPSGLYYNASEEEAEKREKEIRAGLEELKGSADYLAPLGEDWQEEFSHSRCESCGALPGRRHGVAIVTLKKEEEK